MKSETFLDGMAQIEGAEAAIEEIDGQVSAFFAANPHRLVRYIDKQAGIEVWRFRVPSELPRKLRVTVRNALQNLRAPLDHLVHALAIQHSGKAHRRTAFPFGRTRQAFERELPKKTEQCSPEVVKAIEDMQPYPTSPDYHGGNNLLFALHELNRGDKHFSLVTANLHTAKSDMGGLKAWSGRVLTIGPRSGRHMFIDNDNNMIQDVAERRPRYNATKKAVTFGIDPPFSAKDSMEVITCLPGTKFQVDVQPTFTITFCDIKSLEGEPIVAVLNQMRDLVAKTLLTFEERFFG